MQNFNILGLPQKRNLWYSDVALATSYMGRVIPTLSSGFPMARTPYMPNFSLLGLLHGSEEGPVAHGHGPGHLQLSEGHPHNAHHLPHGQLHLHTQIVVRNLLRHNWQFFRHALS